MAEFHLSGIIQTASLSLSWDTYTQNGIYVFVSNACAFLDAKTEL